eukprot:3932178-Rhodomonas_salina.1
MCVCGARPKCSIYNPEGQVTACEQPPAHTRVLRHFACSPARRRIKRYPAVGSSGSAGRPGHLSKQQPLKL